MNSTTPLFRLRRAWSQSRVLVVSLVVALSAAFTNVDLFHASALGQLSSRKVTVTSSQLSASTIYTYAFTLATSGTVQSMKFEACTTPLGTCSTVTGQNINGGTEASRSGWSGATTFTRDGTGGGGCTPGNNVLCIKRTDATSESSAKTLGWNTQVNPSSANTTFYVRVTTYSDTGWTTGVDNGIVAASTATQLDINGRVQENLVFCVGTINGSAPSDCSGITGSTVDLGIIDSSAVSVTPVAVSPNGGNNLNGAAWLTTNATSGATITFYSEQDTSSGAFKVVGASCSGSSTTDQCFNSAPSSQTSGATGAIVAGTEKFGMTVSTIDTSQSTTSALSRGADYDGDGNTGGTCNTGTGANCWVWNATTTAATLASSSSAVDKEMLVLKFAATAAATTPFGSYTVKTTYVATPTF